MKVIGVQGVFLLNLIVMLSRGAPTNLHLVAMLKLQVLLIVCLNQEVLLLGSAVIILVIEVDLLAILGRVAGMVDAIGGGRGGEGGRQRPLQGVHR